MEETFGPHQFQAYWQANKERFSAFECIENIWGVDKDFEVSTGDRDTVIHENLKSNNLTSNSIQVDIKTSSNAYIPRYIYNNNNKK